MPIDWQIRQEAKLATVTANGRIDLAATLEVIVELTGSPEFSPGYRVLVDLREMQYAPSLREAMEIAQALSTLRRLLQSRIAVVAASSFHLRLVQMTSAMARLAGLNQRGFDDIEIAKRWLDGA